jgi:hypothetical protein
VQAGWPARPWIALGKVAYAARSASRCASSGRRRRQRPLAHIAPACAPASPRASAARSSRRQRSRAGRHRRPRAAPARPPRVQIPEIVIGEQRRSQRRGRANEAPGGYRKRHAHRKRTKGARPHRLSPLDHVFRRKSVANARSRVAAEILLAAPQDSPRPDPTRARHRPRARDRARRTALGS